MGLEVGEEGEEGAVEAEIHLVPHDEVSMANAIFVRRYCCFWIPWTSGRSSSTSSSTALVEILMP